MDNIANSLHPFLPQKHLFRAYDIRGDYRFFTNDFIESLAQSFAHTFNGLYKTNIIDKTSRSDPKTIIIGHDMRAGSERIAKHFATVFTKHDFQVRWLGLVTTPMMVFWASQQSNNQQNGLMVTASHSAKNMTGIKWVINGQTPTTQDIKEIYQEMMRYPITIINNTQLTHKWFLCQDKLDFISYPEISYKKAIQHAIQKVNTSTSINTLMDCIVVDCLNGATSTIAKTIFNAYAHEVILLNDTPDGTFPKGNPDPSEAYRLIELQNAVKQYKANLGLAFDGDGDRLVIVDNQGGVVSPDNLLYLLAKTAIEGQQNLHNKDGTKSGSLINEVIFDVKCSHKLPKMMSDLGITPIMSKTGSNHMRHQMLNSANPTLFAGEHSGHFIFNDGLFITHDDGVYAGIRLMSWLSNQRQSLSEIIASLPTMISTADTYIDVAQRQSIMSKLMSILRSWLESGTRKLGFNTNVSQNFINFNDKLSKQATLTTIDGIRLDFDNGFAVIRQSNTSQSLTVRFAGDTIADFKKIQQQFVHLCKQLDEQLAKAIANIQPLTH